MAENGQAPVIVKKITKGGGEGHHGGAWKVAYADFVTAMMAFFLLMWLLNATTEKQRKGIADYFDPSIPLARVSAGGAGMLNGDSVVARERRSGSDEPRPDAEPAELLERPETGPDRIAALAAETAAAADAEERRLAALAESLEEAVEGFGDGSHFQIGLSPEGLTIELVDTGDEPLFASGSADPQPLLVRLMAVMVPVLELATNPIAVVGHTDASPFLAPGRDNWSLSTARALRARELMLAAGLAPERIRRVTGKAATRPLSADPLAPENRRIAVTLLRERAPLGAP